MPTHASTLNQLYHIAKLSPAFECDRDNSLTTNILAIAICFDRRETNQTPLSNYYVIEQSVSDDVDDVMRVRGIISRRHRKKTSNDGGHYAREAFSSVFLSLSLSLSASRLFTSAGLIRQPTDRYHTGSRVAGLSGVMARNTMRHSSLPVSSTSSQLQLCQPALHRVTSGSTPVPRSTGSL